MYMYRKAIVPNLQSDILSKKGAVMENNNKQAGAADQNAALKPQAKCAICECTCDCKECECDCGCNCGCDEPLIEEIEEDEE